MDGKRPLYRAPVSPPVHRGGLLPPRTSSGCIQPQVSQSSSEFSPQNDALPLDPKRCWRFQHRAQPNQRRKPLISRTLQLVAAAAQSQKRIKSSSNGRSNLCLSRASTSKPKLPPGTKHRKTSRKTRRQMLQRLGTSSSSSAQRITEMGPRSQKRGNYPNIHRTVASLMHQRAKVMQKHESGLNRSQKTKDIT